MLGWTTKCNKNHLDLILTPASGIMVRLAVSGKALFRVTVTEDDLESPGSEFISKIKNQEALREFDQGFMTIQGTSGFSPSYSSHWDIGRIHLCSFTVWCGNRLCTITAIA